MRKSWILALLWAGCAVEDEDTGGYTSYADEPTSLEYQSLCFFEDPEFGCRENDGKVGDVRKGCGDDTTTHWYECVTDELNKQGEAGWEVDLGDDKFPQARVLYLMTRPY